jgi:hypothetical protein
MQELLTNKNISILTKNKLQGFFWALPPQGSRKEVPGGREVYDVDGPLGEGVLEHGEGVNEEADVTGSVLEPSLTGLCCILEESKLCNENTLVVFTGLLGKSFLSSIVYVIFGFFEVNS